jgi:transcriptional regulator with XRE-family HTH domain
MVQVKKKKISRASMAERLGSRIAALRKAQGWTQSELAERAGVETETISRFERGATLPSLPTLETLSGCLRVGISELLAEASAQPDDQAARISGWLGELSAPDRAFALDLLKRTCEHLRGA